MDGVALMCDVRGSSEEGRTDSLLSSLGEMTYLHVLSCTERRAEVFFAYRRSGVQKGAPRRRPPPVPVALARCPSASLRRSFSVPSRLRIGSSSGRCRTSLTGRTFEPSAAARRSRYGGRGAGSPQGHGSADSFNVPTRRSAAASVVGGSALPIR